MHTLFIAIALAVVVVWWFMAKRPCPTAETFVAQPYILYPKNGIALDPIIKPHTSDLNTLNPWLNQRKLDGHRFTVMETM